MIATLKGRVLVAMPVLEDANFDRTVVLMLEHNEEGALGVVLNRPTSVAVDDELPKWHAKAAEPAVVFQGGPVAPGAAIGLARSSGDPDGWDRVAGDVGTVDLSRDPDDVRALGASVRVFSGYAGWGPGQLEGELALRAWLVCDAGPDDLLSNDPEGLWRLILRRQPAPVSLLASYPPAPEWN